MFSQLEQIGQIQDVQPIRAASFAPDGEMFAIGTNSKSLKIYTMRPLFIPKEAEYPHSIEMVFEKNNHHFGSIYSVDWSNTGRFIATGSNDKLIKVISVPDFKTDVLFALISILLINLNRLNLWNLNYLAIRV